VPAGLGAQEAGIVVVCGALGLDPQVAIGLALAKRMREVLFGVPALLGWNWWEGARGWGRRKVPADSALPSRRPPFG
jgi:transketolase N-terminal domain/subunit